MAATGGQGADVWLSADGIAIRPMVNEQGMYRFVVPAGAERVPDSGRAVLSLLSIRGHRHLGGGRSLGVQVSAIAIPLAYRAGADTG